MTQQDPVDPPRAGLSRRTLVQASAALAGVPFLATTRKALGADKLAGSGEVVVFSTGGSFTAGARQYVFEPFMKATGIKVVEVTADLAEPGVKAMKQAGRIDWDVATIRARNHPDLQAAGIFEPIDYSLWD